MCYNVVMSPVSPRSVPPSCSEPRRPETTGPDSSGATDDETTNGRAASDPEGPLPGTVCEQFIRCGKPNCRCRKGEPHGPYFYRIWRDGPTVNKVYVCAQDLARVRGQCDQYRVLDEDLRALRARRLAYTARLQAQIRRSARLRQQRGS